ncbi:MAG: 16S rRNA (guanine(966)-N(2))-methyltransferase RsmD [Bacteroidetes bacterium]|nr:MAG: 16S rRNA (guanine(966)-N(2))-methyltransferase RsmD [Bacteroidota bacterium]
MRIVSGQFRGRRIHPPASLPVRPTTDYAKEGLFNVLNNLIDFSGTTVVDLYAGTGSISFEFASRGSPSVLAVDIERRCVDFINQTAAKFGMQGLRAIRSHAAVFLRQARMNADLVFADPPYGMEGIEELPELIRASGIVKPSGIVILEHSNRYNFTADPGFNQLREYGKVCFSIFSGMGDEP